MRLGISTLLNNYRKKLDDVKNKHEYGLVVLWEGR